MDLLQTAKQNSSFTIVAKQMGRLPGWFCLYGCSWLLGVVPTVKQWTCCSDLYIRQLLRKLYSTLYNSQGSYSALSDPRSVARACISSVVRNRNSCCTAQVTARLEGARQLFSWLLLPCFHGCPCLPSPRLLGDVLKT